MSDVFELSFKPIVVFIIVVLFLFVNSKIFKSIKSTTINKDMSKSAISIFIFISGLISFIMVLPIEKELKGQILSFLGIIVSAGIALSSTTLLGNLIAGIMNNSMDRFKIGDLVSINELRGRVVKQSIFHVELQLEDSNFISIPNLFIANNPVKLTKKSNTIVSTSVSLGYDVSRKKIEEILINAALSIELKDPYVYIMSLGDFSVVYKIHGFLEDSDKFFTINSLLNAKVIDKLHEQSIEIVSPNFVNQRRVDEKEFIYKQKIKDDVKDDESPEDLVFKEAIKSEEKAELEKRINVL